MSALPTIPDDLEQCQRLLLDLLQRTAELQQQVEEAQRQAEEARRQIDEARRQSDTARQQAETAAKRADDHQRCSDELQRILDETAADYSQLQDKHAEVLEQLALLRRYIFGPRRERHVDDPAQGHLFGVPELTSTNDAALAPAAPGSASEGERPKSARRRRRASFDHLPHQRVEHDVSDEEKTCSCCGGAKERIGEDLSPVLEFTPAKLEVHVHVLPKYACPKCRDGVVSPPPPPKPIPGGIASTGLVAHVVVCKLSDHIPLYRLEDILFRSGAYLARSTLCDWVRHAADLLMPLAELEKQLLLQSPVLWTDDTFVTVLGGTSGSFKGRFWPYIGDAEHPYTVYDFTMSRARDGPAAFLEDFSGFLHADAYSGYDGIFLGSNGKIIEVACWAHARRKFYDARSNAPLEANIILEWIRQLYDIEDRARDFPAADRQLVRQLEAVPILDRIERYIAEISPRVLPKSALGKALTYVRNQWKALRRYVTDGRLTIDNNVSERTVRLQAIGRKNWLFLGSERAGPRAAAIFTVLASAKRHYLEPWAYLSDVLLHLCVGAEDLRALLPNRWALNHPEHVLEHRLDEARQRAARQKAKRQHRRDVARTRVDR